MDRRRSGVQATAGRFRRRPSRLLVAGRASRGSGARPTSCCSCRRCSGWRSSIVAYPPSAFERVAARRSSPASRAGSSRSGDSSTTCSGCGRSCSCSPRSIAGAASVALEALGALVLAWARSRSSRRGSRSAAGRPLGAVDPGRLGLARVPGGAGRRGGRGRSSSPLRTSSVRCRRPGRWIVALGVAGALLDRRAPRRAARSRASSSRSSRRPASRLAFGTSAGPARARRRSRRRCASSASSPRASSRRRAPDRRRLRRARAATRTGGRCSSRSTAATRTTRSSSRSSGARSGTRTTARRCGSAGARPPSTRRS